MVLAAMAPRPLRLAVSIAWPKSMAPVPASGVTWTWGAQMVLPPFFVSLPFKLLLFILVDGWHLVVGSLVQSFHG